MRKYNSSIKTAFISEAGNQLRNNDYFGFVELDKFACYVIADGITSMGGAESAKAAISAAVDAFQREPGISRRKLKGYLRCANRELLQGKSYEKQKASVTVVVSDYVKFRYGQAGNTRLRLYRDGRCVQASRDMSLSQDLADGGQLMQDRVARHEERNNLTAWLGSEHFRPFISKKKKLCAGDIITLYTRGIWENVDEGELADVFAEAGNEPMEECDKVEDLLLSRQPADLDNYTFAAVYIEKVFTDPNRKKRIKKVIAVSVTAAVIAAVAALVIWLWHRDRMQKRADMEQYAANAAQYTDAGNFPRAKEEYGKALEQARKLRDAEAVDRYTAHLMAAEAVISADDLYGGADYAGAKEAYIRAAEQARQADNAGLSYIDGKLQQIGEYEQVFDSMELGDILFEQDNYGQAEEKYLEAKAKAAAIYYTEGKQQALDALDRLYAEWSAVKEEEERQKKEREQENEEQAAALAADQAAAAELVRQGEAAFSEGDYDGANVFYLIAVEKYAALEDTAQIEFLNMKITALKEKQAETAARAEDAKALEDLARQLEELNDYTQAKIHYQYAKAAYLEIGKNNKADEIQGKIDLIDAKEAQAEKERQQEKEEQEAKEKAEAEEKEEREKKSRRKRKREKRRKRKKRKRKRRRTTDTVPAVQARSRWIGRQMTEEREFDYRDYIQRQLREIGDLDERRYAKELLLGSLGEMFAWTEAKYRGLEQRIRDELDTPWERFDISMTAVRRKDHDPINDHWHPVCGEDLRPEREHGCMTVYLMADDAGCRKFLRQGMVEAEDRRTGATLRCRIVRPTRYRACMERTYRLFAANRIPWQTVHLGHLERFFDLVPDGDVPPGAQPVIQWGDWEQCVTEDAIPLWNMQRSILQSQEFRRPCLDDVVYEHIYYLGDEGAAGDGCLVDAGEELLSVRYERNRVVLKTRKETPGEVSVCRLRQGDGGDSYGYRGPVLSNHRKDSFAVRYLQQTGNFIQTPAELMRRVEEMSGIFRISVSGYEILGGGAAKDMLEGDMNSFIGTQVFTGDRRSLLVFRFRKEGETPYDYLYGSQIRYILSQLQMEFMEYRCVGVAE